MKNITYFSVFFVSILFLIATGCKNEPQQPERVITRDSAIMGLASLYTLKAPPQSGEWLATHDEVQQTFEEYMKYRPTTIDDIRNKLYVQPLGTFTAAQQAIVVKTIAYLEAFYGLKVITLPVLNDSAIYFLSRENPVSYALQLYTPHILDSILERRLPPDAAAMIALTAIDLYPDPSWNFVFGQAKLRTKVGVWSMSRFGNPDESSEAFAICLQRTLKTAAHETGHMFSIKHCVTHNCCMNGTNHLDETDSRPVWFCHECLEKLCVNLRYDPKIHFSRIESFWQQNGQPEIASFYGKNLAVLRKP